MKIGKCNQATENPQVKPWNCVFVCVREKRTWVCVYVCVYMYIYIYIYINVIYTYIHDCEIRQLCVCACACERKRMWVRMYVCIHMYIYIHLHVIHAYDGYIRQLHQFTWKRKVEMVVFVVSKRVSKKETQSLTALVLRGGGRGVGCVYMCVCVCLCVCVWQRKSMRVSCSAQEPYHLNITNSIIYQKKKWGSLLESICLVACLQQEEHRLSANSAQKRCQSLDQSKYTLTALRSAFVCLQQAHICTDIYIYIGICAPISHPNRRKEKREKEQKTPNILFLNSLGIGASLQQ